MKKKAVLFVYGEGGHKAEMNELVNKIYPYFINKKICFIGFCENNHAIEKISVNYSFLPIRDKYSSMITFINFFKNLPKFAFVFINILKCYDIKMLITSGPSLAILPSLLFKLAGKKVIYIESSARFETKSFTGIVMYHLSDVFYIQNESLKKNYPSAVYCGLLI